MSDTLTNNEAGLSKPDLESGRLQRAILKILREHEQQPDGLPTSGRFIFYELVQRGIIDKKAKTGGRRPDQNVADALFPLRTRPNWSLGIGLLTRRAACHDGRMRHRSPTI